MTPRPGDFAVINTGTRLTSWIELGERLYTGGKSGFDHAVICSQVTPSGLVRIVEAQPGGAVESDWHYEERPHLWSTGAVSAGSSAGAAALKYVGVPYSFADYGALAVRRWHLPVPGLRGFVADTGHMICSQLVDQAEHDAGVELFTDGRWPGFVTPQDLANLITSAGLSGRP